MSEFRENYVGNGRVYLLNKQDKIFTDIAARFVRSEKPVAQIVDSEYSAKIVANILESGHFAATEFDTLVFAVEGYSRATEAQLIRKRIGASYLIKSGRQELNGKRAFSMVAPEEVYDAEAPVVINDEPVAITGREIMKVIQQWYDYQVAEGMKEEIARYVKPQATEFKAIVGLNTRSLYDLAALRMCLNAQTEIRDLVTKMVHLAKEAYPDLYKNIGPNCVRYGVCPEGRLQNEKCKGKIPTRVEIDEAYKFYKAHKSSEDLCE